MIDDNDFLQDNSDSLPQSFQRTDDGDFDRELPNRGALLAGIMAMLIAGGSTTSVHEPLPDNLLPKSRLVVELQTAVRQSPEIMQDIISSISNLIDADENQGVFMEVHSNGSASILAHNNLVLNSTRPFFSLNIQPGESIQSLNNRIFEMTGYHLEMNPYLQSKEQAKLNILVYPMNIAEFSSNSLHTFPFASVELFVSNEQIIGIRNTSAYTYIYSSDFLALARGEKNIDNSDFDFRFVDFGPIP